MIRNQHFVEAVTSPDGFERTLGQVLGAAATHGIDPRGSWVFRADDHDHPDLEAMIVELEKNDSSE